MNEGWIKLYRRVLDNGILKDQVAWVIFSWLLLKVDKGTGKKSIGRFWASEELGLNSNTFYKALKRLEKKWQMVTLSSNNKCTEISLINWNKYQSSNSASNNKVTTKEQQSNTLQEERIKNKEERGITQAFLISLKETYPTINVVEEWNKAKDWLAATGKKYKDYEAFFRNWIRRITPVKGADPDLEEIRRLQKDDPLYKKLSERSQHGLDTSERNI